MTRMGDNNAAILNADLRKYRLLKYKTVSRKVFYDSIEKVEKKEKALYMLLKSQEMLLLSYTKVLRRTGTKSCI